MPATISSKGFSLIEVLASLLVLSGLMAVIVQLSYGNVRRVKKAQRLEKTAQLLEFKMQELEEQFKSRPSSFPEQAEGSFEQEEHYSWSYTVQPLSTLPPRILLSVAQIPDNELNLQMAGTLTEVLSEAVKELKLTVYHNREKRGQKEFSYSLSAYFVNTKDAPDFVFRQLKGLADVMKGGGEL